MGPSRASAGLHEERQLDGISALYLHTGNAIEKTAGAHLIQ
jgi:hypothetical protein